MPRFEVVWVAGGRHIFLLKNMKPAPGSPTDRLWLALPCSFLGRFMAPRGISYFFLGTHACPASLVPLREFRFSSAGWCGNGVRIAPLRGCYPVATIRTCIAIHVFIKLWYLYRNRFFSRLFTCYISILILDRLCILPCNRYCTCFTVHCSTYCN